MARWHRLVNAHSTEVVWTDTPAAYSDDWKETETASRPPGDHEDKIGGKWVTDEPKRKQAERRRKLSAMHHDERVDHIVDVVLERLRAAGLKI